MTIYTVYLPPPAFKINTKVPPTPTKSPPCIESREMGVYRTTRFDSAIRGSLVVIAEASNAGQ